MRDIKPQLIFLTSIPKAGTHFFIEILQQALGSYFLYKAGWGADAKELLTWGVDALEGKLDLAYKKSHILVPSHTPNTFYAFSERIRNDSQTKGIFLCRDPRDLIVSYVKSTQAGIWPEGDLEKYYEGKTELEMYLNTMEHFEVMLSRYTQYFSSEEFLIVRYEDLLGIDRGGNVNTQGRTIDAIASLLGVCSLDVARGFLAAPARPTWTKRKGGARVGQWKEIYTDEMLKHFDKIYGKLMRQWEY